MAEEVVFKISAKWDDLNRTLTSSSKAIDDWSKKNLGGFSSMAQSLGTLALRFSALAGPVVGAGAAIYGLAQKTANAGDELHDMSKRTGIAVETLSGLKYAAELTGTDINGLAIGLKFLNKNISEARDETSESAKVFKALGISVVDSNGKLKSTETIFLQLSDKFKRMEDGAGKTALSMQLFGRSATDIIPLLNEGGDGIRKMTDEAKKLGITFTTEGAAAADQFNDNMTKLKGNFNGLVQTIGNDLIPALNKLFDVMNPKESAFARLKKVEDAIKNLPKTGWDAKFIEERLAILAKEREALLKELTHTSPGQIGDKKKQAPAIPREKKPEAKTDTVKDLVEYTDQALGNYFKMVKAQESLIEMAAKNRSDEMEAQLRIIDINEQMWEMDREALDEQIKKEEDAAKKIAEEREKAWSEGMQDYQAGLSAISSGSISQIAGLFGEYGKIVGAVIELITNIGKLPDLLKASIKGLVEGAKDFGKAIVTIIKDIIVNLPTILAEIIIELVDSVDEIIEALIDGIPKFVTNFVKAIPAVIVALITEIPQIITALIQGIPQLVFELISGIWEGIKAIFTGGEISSAVDDWTEEASTVTVELDTTNAMNALMTAQDALLGALNDTDRAVAREALLSARSAAILAESASESEDTAEDWGDEFEGIFSFLSDWLEDLWDTISDAWSWLEDIFSSIGDALEDIFNTWWDSAKATFNFLEDIFSNIWDALEDIFNGWLDGAEATFNFLEDIFSDAWDSLSGTLGGWIDDLWDTLTSWIDDLADIFDFGGGGDFWDSLSSGFGLWHDGGLLKKAHSGMYVGGGLQSYEVPIIAKYGEGILNDYNGMKAIGGEAGLNFANKNGYLPGGGQQIITQNISLNVVTDKEGNVTSLTTGQGKNFVRSLIPGIKELQRTGELSFA